ncbi:hypothetical protein Tco_1277861, partial [Tanacetum coccineum]
MAAQSSSTTTGVGSSSAPTIAQILPTTPDVWQHYNLCKMTDNSTKAQSLKSVPEVGQSSNVRDASLFVYNPDVIREQFASLVIQQGLPFNHFDNAQMTRVFQTHMQPKHNH